MNAPKGAFLVSINKDMKNRLKNESNIFVDAFDETMLYGMKLGYVNVFWDEKGMHTFFIYANGTKAVLNGSWEKSEPYDYWNIN